MTGAPRGSTPREDEAIRISGQPRLELRAVLVVYQAQENVTASVRGEVSR